MNFAGVKKLPVIFVVENNEYAISVPIEEQYANKRMADRAKAYGFEGVTVDGSDFTEVYLAFKEAVKAARGKKGPKLIELMVSRLTSHSADDDQSVYRSKEENEENMMWFMNNHPFKLESIDDCIPEELHSETTALGYLQLLPGVHGTDGFFIAKFRRK